MHACQKDRNLEIVRLLLAAGVDVEARDKSQQTALHHAAQGWTPLIGAINSKHCDIVQFLLDSGADPHHVDRYGHTALMLACQHGRLETVRLLLDACVDVEARDRMNETALHHAARRGDIEVVRELILHRNANIFAVNNHGWTPLIGAVKNKHYDIVRFLLDSGADPHYVDGDGVTALMHACQGENLEIVRLLLAAGADVEARDKRQYTALHHTARWGSGQVIRELILQHNANMFAVNQYGRTPYDEAYFMERPADVIDHLLEMYGNKLSQDHGSIALHELLKIAKYSFCADMVFHQGGPPLDLLQMIVPLGRLREKHLRTLLHILDPELIRIRDSTGKLPIHIACQTKAPVEVLALILDLDPTTLRTADNTGMLPIHIACQTKAPVEVLTLILKLNPAALRIADNTGKLPIHLACQTNAPVEILSLMLELNPAALRIADNTGSLPIHLLCGATTSAASEHASVRYLVEQGRNRQGLLPLHVLCRSRNPPLRAIQYLMQSFPGSVAVQTNAGDYPFMMAAAAGSSSASLSVIYELVRANPGLAVPR